MTWTRYRISCPGFIDGLLSSILVLVLLGSFNTATASTRSADRPASVDFPVYPSIRSNVDFWKNIFTRYAASDGVLHDSERVDIVYDVLRLDSRHTVRAKRKNKAIQKKAVKKYKTILLRLSEGHPARTKDEKRITALFGENTEPEAFRRAAFNIRCQTGLKEEFKKGLSRSGAVIDEFKKIFNAHGLPEDLVYLPCVESSYNFKAYSKFGAAGIWQFTRSTGRQYMKINYVVDERRDPFISTVAAARLLKKNYTELKNWPMAITAYNHGLAGMRRAKKKKGSYEKIFTSYRSRTFKFASRNFYSEFLAARDVALNAEKYFGQINYQHPRAFITIRTRGYLSVDDLTRHLNISVSEIRKLNPSLRQPVFNGQKYIPSRFDLRLPAGFSPTQTGKLFSGIYRKKQKPSRYHRVEKGETAGAIARLHSVSLSDLILANQLDRRATIYIGQNLRIPVEDEGRTPAATVAATVQKQPTVGIKPPENKPVEKAKLVEAPKAQPIKEEILITRNIVTGNLNVIETYQKMDLTIGVIKVEAEETLGHYADWLQIPTREIRALNGFKYGRGISVDQKIKLPMRRISVSEFESRRYEYHKEIEENFFESFAIQAMEVYKVKNGDNIWTLCQNELEVPFWLVRKYNPEIDFNTLIPRQKIHYPVLSSQSEN